MPLPRRRFLQGAGSFIALPSLASLGAARGAGAAAAPPRPKRMVFIAIGWGVTEETWYPDRSKTGADWVLPDGLQPLARHKQSITVVQNVYHKHSSDAHNPSMFWLTGADRYGVPGKSFNNTISVDQVAAEQFGRDTRFASLSLCGSTAEGGHGQMQWNRQGKPLPSIENPVAVYHKLFSDEKTPLDVRQRELDRQKSVLDVVLEEATFVSRGLSRDDTDKLDEYFESIREIETRLAKEKQWLAVPKSRPQGLMAEPSAGADGRNEIRITNDLMLAAFQADATRVIGYRLPVDALLRSLGKPVGGHNMSHYGPGPRMEASQARDRAISELLAGFLDRLQAVKEPDGSSLFDQTSVVLGSNVRSQHYLDNCPTLLTGGGAGLKLGRHIVMKDPKTPLCNVWLTLLKGVGLPVDSFGDSTGVIEDLVA
jgi:hypothetical protein